MSALSQDSAGQTTRSHAEQLASPLEERTRPPVPRAARTIEIVVLTGLAFCLAGWAVRGGHYIGAIAAIVQLLPAFVGLQHGLASAALTASLSALALALGADEALAPGALFKPLFFPFALAFTAGHLRDRWDRSSAALAQVAEAQAEQLEQLSRSHGLLRASHAQLEQRLAAEAWSLETAVRRAESQAGERGLSGAAEAVLELLAAQGKVGAAAIFLAREGRLCLRPQAQVGPPSEVDSRHPLIQAAFGAGAAVHLNSVARCAGEHQGEVLLAVPLVSSSGRRVGVVAIYELCFVDFHDAHFALLSLLAAQFADALAHKLAPSETVAERPTLARVPPASSLAEGSSASAPAAPANVAGCAAEILAESWRPARAAPRLSSFAILTRSQAALARAERQEAESLPGRATPNDDLA